MSENLFASLDTTIVKNTRQAREFLSEQTRLMIERSTDVDHDLADEYDDLVQRATKASEMITVGEEYARSGASLWKNFIGQTYEHSFFKRLVQAVGDGLHSQLVEAEEIDQVLFLAEKTSYVRSSSLFADMIASVLKMLRMA